MGDEFPEQVIEQVINPMPKSIATAINDIMLKLQKSLDQYIWSHLSAPAA